MASIAALHLLLFIVVSLSLHNFFIAAWILNIPRRVSSGRVRQRMNVGVGEVNIDEPNYLRWFQSRPGDSFPHQQQQQDPMLSMELQTRVTTFQRPMDREGASPSVVQLHAQFHFADRPEYYNLSSSRAINTVFYELLLDESLLQKEEEDGKRRIRQNAPLQSSLTDQQLARQYGWICQVDATRYQQPHWYHADWTRQDFLKRLCSASSSLSPTSSIISDENDYQPLWQSTFRNDRWSAAHEATTALWTGPPMALPQIIKPNTIRRRIFTHLFLPGDALALGLRTLLWLTVPCPELSILLLDGSFFYWSGDSPTIMAQNRLSPILLPLLQAALSGRWQSARQLVFGQVALAGHASVVMGKAEEDDQSLLITQRNDHALQQVFAELERNPQKSIALLFGCHHCPDLHRKLVRAGFREEQSEWRTAWSVPSRIASESEHCAKVLGKTINTPGSIFGYILLLVLPLYFCIGGLDWMETILGVVRSLEKGDGFADAAATSTVFAYLLRHVFLYVGLSKLVLDGEMIRI